MHELFTDCQEARRMMVWDILHGDTQLEVPAWISDVVKMPLVNGVFPPEHPPCCHRAA